MRIFITLLLVIAAFAAGVWYANEYDFQLPLLNETSQMPEQEEKEQPAPVVKATYMNANADRIVVDTPLPGGTVGNTFTVSGKARGGWYFEASFPLSVVSSANAQLVEMPVQATGDWMTSEFVPFTASVSVPASYKGPATLILHNDNASGLPENDASISIPIVIQ